MFRAREPRHDLGVLQGVAYYILRRQPYFSHFIFVSWTLAAVRRNLDSLPVPDNFHPGMDTPSGVARVRASSAGPNVGCVIASPPC